MDGIITRRVEAHVTLLPREDGRPERGRCIASGYHNSNLRFELAGGGGYAPALGGAYLYPVDRDEIGVGETGAVRMLAYGLDALDAELRVGARFVLTEGGRPWVRGTVTALLPDAPDARPPR